jgi:hypothetical protein
MSQPTVSPREWVSGDFLGADAELLKASTNLITSVRSSIRMEQLGFHWTNIHEI